MRLLVCVLLTSFQLLATEAPRPGDEVDLAPFGHARIWDGNPGVEWDEPREIWRVDVNFTDAQHVPAEGALSVEYWVSSWPPVPSGGWTKTDTPWQGEWRKVAAHREVSGTRVVFHFQTLSAAENPNAKNTPGFTPSFRKTLKIRLRVSGDSAGYSSLVAYGNSRWSIREINVQSGCEGKPAAQLTATAYNGVILSTTPVEMNPAGLRLRVLYTEHDPGSDDRTIITIRGAEYAFGVNVDDVIERRAVYVKSLGIFLGDATLREEWTAFQASGTMRPGEDIISRTSRHAEQSLNNAIGEIPRLSLTGRSSRHSLRYIPLGFPASREKYGLDFNGNVFISKHSSKAMKEDLASMQWSGDEIYFRIGTGEVPDFRERPLGASQEILDDALPLVTTDWSNQGIEYQEEAYATMLSAPLDDVRLRGDEPSILMLRLRAHNPGPNSSRAAVWFQVSPSEHLELRGQMLVGVGDSPGANREPRLRAVLESEPATLQVRDSPASVEPSIDVRGSEVEEQKPHANANGGGAVVWTVPLAAHEAKVLDIKIPFRTMVSAADQGRVEQIHFDTRLDETLAYWKKRVNSGGMSLHTPDETLNSFYQSVLQHILVSEERDVKTGLTMCPCGTYDYNMFANETDVQVRLLDMRGLHEEAWKCLRPLVELQGSKPFPGRFKDTSAEFHGVKVDADHDYTHSGYNLNHGWTLWTLAEHYLFTRDDSWLRGIMPRMTRAANWIIDERHVTMQREPDGTGVPEYGLLPAGELEDNEDWEYWFAVNGYAYRGLRAAAEAISALDSREGERLKQEAVTYRDDIRHAALHAMAIAPVVPLRDGTFVPTIPSRTSLHGRDLGWIRNVLYGAHALVDCGVFDADELVTTWTLEDYEDNLLMAPDSLSVPDRDWFSRGGVALQPNLVNLYVSYLERDQLPQELRSLFNDFAVSYYPDVNAFTEWVPTLGIGGGPFYKTSDEAAFLTWLRLALVRESGDRLYLDSGAPREWLLTGRTIDVERAATFFGQASFRIQSHVDRGFVEATISTPQRNPPRDIVMLIRHPQGRRITRVELNGSAWSNFDSERETISIPVDQSKVALRVFYR
ncbi:MAG: hypothetical protein DMG22_02080 [Acidobacteria bacterium]|nr:MAG: hypothetical protein DMG22_02080 [Acidobacteriota bacterium]